MERKKRKYDRAYATNNSQRVARCGHKTKMGRYFKCETCLPVLEDDDGDWTYFNIAKEDEDDVSL